MAKRNGLALMALDEPKDETEHEDIEDEEKSDEDDACEVLAELLDIPEDKYEQFKLAMETYIDARLDEREDEDEELGEEEEEAEDSMLRRRG